MRATWGRWAALAMALALTAVVASAQEPAGQSNGDQTPGSRGTRMRGDGEGRPLLGRITALSGDSIEIETMEGGKVTVKLNDKTDLRRDREAAKLSDFKVGDGVMVRGAENADHSVTAERVTGRSAGSFGGGRRGQMGPMGTLGKDFVAGQVKSIEAPDITVTRTDNVEQTIELNEDTSLRKGRDSVTMADVHPGDHLMARGALVNDKFIPKMVMIFTEEQWKRMKEFRNGGGRRTQEGAGKPAPSGSTEPQN